MSGSELQIQPRQVRSVPHSAPAQSGANSFQAELGAYEKTLTNAEQLLHRGKAGAEQGLAHYQRILDEGTEVASRWSSGWNIIPGVGAFRAVKDLVTGAWAKPLLVGDAERGVEAERAQLKRLELQGKALGGVREEVERAKKFLSEGKSAEAQGVLTKLREEKLFEGVARSFSEHSKASSEVARSFAKTGTKLERAQVVAEIVRDGSAMAGAIAAAPALGVIGATAVATGMGAVVNTAGEGAHVAQGLKSSREAIWTVLERTGESAITGATTGVGLGAARVVAQSTARVVGAGALTRATSGAAGSVAFSNVQTGVSLLRGQELTGSDYAIDIGTGALAGALGAQSGAIREELRTLTKKGLSYAVELGGDIGLGVTGAYAKASTNGTVVTFQEVASQIQSSIVGSTVGEISSSQITHSRISEPRQLKSGETRGGEVEAPELLTTQGGAFPIPERVERTTNRFSWDTYRPGGDGVLFAQKTKESGGGDQRVSENESHEVTKRENGQRDLSLKDIREARRVIALQTVGVRALADALTTARGIEDARYRADALGELGLAQAKAGFFADALTTAQGIESARFRAGVLGEIGVAQAKAGLFADALTTARGIENARVRAGALREIGVAQAKAGLDPSHTFADALTTARGIEGARDRVNVLRKLGVAQAKAGLDPSHTLADALTTARGMEYAHERAEALREIGVVQAEAGLDPSHTFADALTTAQGIENARFRAGVLGEIGVAQAKAGLDPSHTLADALTTARGMEYAHERAEALREIGVAQAVAGLDPSHTFAEALTTVRGNEDARYTADALGKLGLAQAEAGLFADALTTARGIEDAGLRATVLLEIGVAQAKAGLDPSRTFADAFTTALGVWNDVHRAEILRDLVFAEAKAGLDPSHISYALTTARGIEGASNRAFALRRIGVAEAEAGLDPSHTFADARTTALKIENDRQRAIALVEIGVAQANAGLFAEALTTAQVIVGDPWRAGALREIGSAALLAASNSRYRVSEILSADTVILNRVLGGKHDRVAEDVGLLAPKETRELLLKAPILPTFQRHSLELGAAEATEDLGAAGSVASRVKVDSPPVEKRALARALSHHPDPLQNSVLLEKLRTEDTDQAAVRYLHTLVHGESPKGRTVATELAVDPRVNEKRREFLVKLLFDSGHWDQTLGKELEGELRSGKTSKRAVNEILHGLVTELGLTPDRSVYRALEGDGLLVADTVPGRINELRSYRSRFEGRTWEELRSELGRDPKASQIYYMLKGGEQQYALINDYSYSKFKTILDKVNALKVDPQRMQEFEKSVMLSGKTAEEARSISSEMLQGRFPGVGEKRVVEFTTDVVKGSTHEEALNRMQDIWQTEFRGLLLAGAKNGEVANIAQVRSQLGETHDPVHSLRELGKGGVPALRLLERLKLEEKLTPERVEEIAKEFRNSLTQRAKSNKDKSELERIKGLSSSEAITEYVATVVPALKNSGALQEWRSHLDEVTAELKRENRTSSASSQSFELTFLDKGKDLMRALRFADAQRCCFNSSQHNLHGELSSADWVARLHRDPLSFIVDIKPQGTDVITGFVFGRIGTDPQNGHPVVMLNGIYSQLKGPTFNDNVLTSIEEGFAKKIGASKIVLASQYGGALPTPPSGYTMQTLSLNALRALPGSETYDDIGTVANGVFKFTGYVKELVTENRADRPSVLSRFRDFVARLTG